MYLRFLIGGAESEMGRFVGRPELSTGDLGVAGSPIKLLVLLLSFTRFLASGRLFLLKLPGEVRREMFRSRRAMGLPIS